MSLAQVVLKTGLDMLILSFSGRGGLLSELCHYLSKEDKKKIEEIYRKIDKIQDNYLRKVDNLEGSDLEKIRSELKQFFDITNTSRNTVKKSL